MIAALDRGEVRVAEPDGDDWRVNADVQAAILDYFRERQMEPREVGPFEYHDKIPLKSGYVGARRARRAARAVARYGAFLSRGVVLMPSYVNIGAWVGPNTMVDTWATVGSGAQIGANVHLAGGVGIGGVLEPPGARPVIVEDGAFLGSRCIVVEGVRIGREAVLAPNVTLTAQRADHRRHGLRAGRAPRLRAAAGGRRAGHAAEGVPGGHVPPLVRAHHRLAQRVDRPEDVAERRAARLRDRRARRARPGRSGRPARPRSGRAARRPGKRTTPARCRTPPRRRPRSIPDDAVSPTPRSQTRASIAPPRDAARDLNVRPLREALVRLRAAARSRSRSAGSPSTTACGFPTSTATKRTPATSSGRRDDHVAQILLDEAVGEQPRDDLARADAHRDPVAPLSLREPAAPRSACRCRTSPPASRRGSRSRSPASRRRGRAPRGCRRRRRPRRAPIRPSEAPQ